MTSVFVSLRIDHRNSLTFSSLVVSLNPVVTARVDLWSSVVVFPVGEEQGCENLHIDGGTKQIACTCGMGCR